MTGMMSSLTWGAAMQLEAIVKMSALASTAGIFTNAVSAMYCSDHYMSVRTVHGNMRAH